MIGFFMFLAGIAYAKNYPHILQFAFTFAFFYHTRIIFLLGIIRNIMTNKEIKTEGGFRAVLRSVFDIGGTVLISVAAVIIIRTYVVQPFLVSGSSMEPTFQDGNYLLIDEISYHLRDPKRGEVIVFKYPGNPKTFYVKRVIGLPGETIEIKDNKVSVKRGEKEIVLEEGYVSTRETDGDFASTLEKNEYFMMGDNRNFSFDSRRWGPLKRSSIIGIVRLRLWPVNEVMAFGRPNY